MNAQLPTLETDRLILRPFTTADAPQVQAWAGDRRIYETTLHVPHPYQPGMAEAWIATHQPTYAQGNGLQLAITRKADSQLVGAIGFGATPHHHRAELGYWIGVPFWSNGYCTEAAIEFVRHGFAVLGYHKISCRHFECDPASGRVMQKAGMTREGVLRDDIFKDGRYHTTVVYGMLRPA